MRKDTRLLSIQQLRQSTDTDTRGQMPPRIGYARCGLCASWAPRESLRRINWMLGLFQKEPVSIFACSDSYSCIARMRFPRPGMVPALGEPADDATLVSCDYCGAARSISQVRVQFFTGPYGSPQLEAICCNAFQCHELASQSA
jgi:hypothetical protein